MGLIVFGFAISLPDPLYMVNFACHQELPSIMKCCVPLNPLTNGQS